MASARWSERIRLWLNRAAPWLRTHMSRQLSELTRPDPIWGSLGIFGYSADPERRLADLEDLIASSQLSDMVPENVRQQFEVVRKIFLHGFFEYDFLWVAAGQAYMVAESALRSRFVQYYNNEIPFVLSSDALKTLTIRAGHFDPVWDFLHDHKKSSGFLLQSKISNVAHRFNGGFAALLRWAFDEQLLPGRKATYVSRVFASARNLAAHPSYGRQPPTMPARQLCDVAEFINCLWGQRTPGGRLFPAPGLIHRVPVVIGRGNGSTVSGLLSGFGSWQDAGEYEIMIVLAASAEDVSRFEPGFESTSSPITLVWGPGRANDASEFVKANPIVEDDVPYVNRVLMIRTGENVSGTTWPFDWPIEGAQLPRSPEATASLPEGERSGEWYVIQADNSDAAFSHVMDRLHGSTFHTIRRANRCVCGVDELAKAVTWEQALQINTPAGQH